MELRDIEIFLTLAEELHFGRTADRLHVSQARVSQAIKMQERRIGGVLFERTSRAVTLTPLGEQLRDDLRTGYDAIRKGLARATESTRGMTGTVRLGVMGIVGHEIRGVIEKFTADHPGCDVALREIVFSDPFSGLRSGDLDLILVWRPVREPDLTEGPTLLTEGRLMGVWTGHELASLPSVSMEDFAGRAVVHCPQPGLEYWIESMAPRFTPGGQAIPRGPAVTTFHEVLTEVAAGRGITPMNEHGLHYFSHPGVVWVPLHDAPITEWALAWRSDDLNRRARAFVDVAELSGPRAYEAPRG
ncbi:LysR family transcriptional regulator [Actinoplanes capillaceus]|uniref:LysR family transcriptional regulator n=1 Tax=Actinoplanes campanulatus TaxID=113559 RepID=A0ABQ3WJX0_9ACTN|nr:LysR family transcriptional regulator [Actinoplanes capillaceus]GID46548.1 LysR family transcriptional regulator [Actinoplanes capillaceus]